MQRAVPDEPPEGTRPTALVVLVRLLRPGHGIAGWTLWNLRTQTKNQKAQEVRSEAEIIAQILEREPDLGATDVSKCAPGWIKTFCEKFEQKQGHTLSHNAVGNLCHTLIAARIRAERLVRERDAALARINEYLESQ